MKPENVSMLMEKPGIYCYKNLKQLVLKPGLKPGILGNIRRRSEMKRCFSVLTFLIRGVSVDSSSRSVSDSSLHRRSSSADHEAVLLGPRRREGAAEAAVGDVRPAGGEQESSGGQHHQQRLQRGEERGIPSYCVKF